MHIVFIADLCSVYWEFCYLHPEIRQSYLVCQVKCHQCNCI